MKVVPTAIPEVLVLEPQVFGDDRGFFFESFNARRFKEVAGLDVQFVQDNHSKSAKGVLRGHRVAVLQPQLIGAAPSTVPVVDCRMFHLPSTFV